MVKGTILHGIYLVKYVDRLTNWRSAEWAGVASGSRRAWPKMESRLRQIRIAKPSSPGVRDKMEPTDS